MAKGVLHLNVEFSAVNDEEGKFGRLATLLGLADADHALGRCTHLWLACTRRGEAELPQWLVEQLLGERGPEALVEAELASWGTRAGWIQLGAVTASVVRDIFAVVAIVF